MTAAKREKGVALFGLAFFLLLWVGVAAELLGPLDRKLLLAIQPMRMPLLTRLAHLAANLGSINFMVPLIGLIVLVLAVLRRWRLAVVFGAALLWYPMLWPVRLAVGRPAPEHSLRSSTEGIVYVAEGALERAATQPERPAAAGATGAAKTSLVDEILKSLRDSLWMSFPSMHAAVTAYFYGIVFLLVRTLPRWRWAAPACLAIILLVGVSRLYMGVHYLTDVLASWGLASVALAVVQWWFFSSRTASSLIPGDHANA